jgi:hypothetical protein
LFHGRNLLIQFLTQISDMHMMPPLCFILMPFGRKPAGDGRLVDFDAVYQYLIKPGVEAAGMNPLRADEEMVGGIIHKAMFERLILCEFAVADLTTANANVFYELGVRHAVRPWVTQLTFAQGWGQLPFDVASLRALPYQLSPDGLPSNAVVESMVLAERLKVARQAVTDSPVFQLVTDFSPPDIKRLKTDVFRDRVRYAESIKVRLADARSHEEDNVAAIEADLGDIAQVEAGVVIDLFLSYRAVKAWDRMIGLADRMAPPLAETVMVKEQVALALNRNGRSTEAEGILLNIIAQHGPSSETYGILGRVYKDRWEAASLCGNIALSQGLLDKAIDTYLKGFESDWRDAYPGINAVTLMEFKSPRDPRQAKLLAIVSYAVERRFARTTADYWDYATKLEIAILLNDKDAADEALCQTLAHVREPWEPETTARNLRLIRMSRAQRGENTSWLLQIEEDLLSKAIKTSCHR